MSNCDTMPSNCDATPPSLSVAVPAYNEERYLEKTLQAIQASIAEYSHREQVDVIVADNNSTDLTADVAEQCGASVVAVAQPGVACARNAGAAATSSDVIVFVDADTIVPRETISRISSIMSHPQHAGGAVDTLYQPRSRVVGAYLAGWRALSRVMHMAQGATQFVRRDAFEAVGGYDESIYMGEDVDFFWRLSRYAKRCGQTTRILRDIRVEPSCRRFDGRPLTTVLAETNPLTIMRHRRSRDHWPTWYERVPR